MLTTALRSAFYAEEGSIRSPFKMDPQEDEGYIKLFPNKKFTKKARDRASPEHGKLKGSQ